MKDLINIYMSRLFLVPMLLLLNLVFVEQTKAQSLQSKGQSQKELQKESQRDAQIQEEARSIKSYAMKIDEFLDVVDEIETNGYIDFDSQVKLQVVINDYMKNEAKYLKDAKRFNELFPEKVFKIILEDLKRATKGDLGLSEVYAEIREHLSNLNYSDWGPMRLLKDPKFGINLTVLNNKTPHFVYMLKQKNLFEEYYTRLDYKYKAKVLRGAIKALKNLDEDDLNSNDSEYVKLKGIILSKIFQNGGPILQKILQRINDALGSSGQNSLIREVLKELLVDINPIDDEKAAAILKSRIPRKGIFKDADKLVMVKRLGAASIGQAHIISIDSKKMVVKFIKPGVSEYASYEAELLSEIFEGSDPSDLILQNMVKTINRIILTETDLSIEEKNLKQGLKSYNLGDIKAVGLPVELNQKGVMSMELADGKDMDRSFRELCVQENPETLINFSTLQKKLYHHVVSNALFGDGYFHGDLHKGNIFIDTKSKKIILIDFGNAHTLTADQKKAVIRLILAFDGDSMDEEILRLGVQELLGIKGDAGEDKVFTEIVEDVISNCILNDTSDKMKAAVIGKWKNGKSKEYKNYARLIDSVVGLCFTPLSNANKVSSEIRRSVDSSSKLKVVLDFLNNANFEVPVQINSFIQSKGMLESQLRVTNGILAKKDVRGDFLNTPEDIFDSILSQNMGNEIAAIKEKRRVRISENALRLQQLQNLATPTGQVNSSKISDQDNDEFLDDF
jgi:predicted unusual protein kinase regulating ubiquinone biosynthesis (AarF/ABC1/UbiB family)